MTSIQGLTEEQEAFTTHVDGTFVHACPGAGKTRTIIARLTRIAATLPPRRGVAVLSFTNAAVDEFRERCQTAGLDSLLKHPSFMGTLDAFLRHFVVLPSCTATSQMRPIILDSWDTLGIEIRLSGAEAFRGDPVSLDRFDPETNIIDPDRIGNTRLKDHVRQHQDRYQQTATRRRNALLQAGYMSAGDARVKMLQLIRDPEKGVALGRALAARFHEIMVDEGQDCNPLDLQILSWLRAHGIQVTFVCDPDQSIYEFRNGKPEGIQEFKDTYPVESQLVLTGNFRSSPTICRLAATLRNADRVDQSVGNSSNIEHPVLLLAYGGRSPTAAIGHAFLDRIEELGLSSADSIILAHSGKVARRAAGAPTNNSSGSSRIELVAKIASEFRSPVSTARSREAALQAVEALLLDFMGLREQNEHPLRAIERLNMDLRAHRRIALSFLMTLPSECENTDADRIAWIACVHEEIERLSLTLPAGVTARNFFRRPSNAQWSNHLQRPINLGLPCANIHEAKGHEYGAVCVVIPPNRAPENRGSALFESWESRSDTEGKRALYVGVTRAKALVSLAVPNPYADRCCALLAAGQVPYTRINL